MHSLLVFEKITVTFKLASGIVLSASKVSMKKVDFQGVRLIDPKYSYPILRIHRSKV